MQTAPVALTPVKLKLNDGPTIEAFEHADGPVAPTCVLSVSFRNAMTLAAFLRVEGTLVDGAGERLHGFRVVHVSTDNRYASEGLDELGGGVVLGTRLP